MRVKTASNLPGRFHPCPVCRGEGRDVAYDSEAEPGYQDGSRALCPECDGATVVEPHRILGELKEQARTEAERIKATLEWEIALRRWVKGGNGKCRKCGCPSGPQRPLMVNYTREPARVLIWCTVCTCATSVGIVVMPEEQKQ